MSIDVVGLSQDETGVDRATTVEAQFGSASFSGGVSSTMASARRAAVVEPPPVVGLKQHGAEQDRRRGAREVKG